MKSAIVLASCLVLALGASASTLDQAPALSAVRSVTPDPAGGTLTIRGEQLASQEPVVLMDGQPLVILSWSPAAIVAALPEVPAGPHSLRVGDATVALTPELAMGTLAMAPEITATSVVDGLITIDGSRFGQSPVVTIGKSTAWIVSASDKQVVAQLPGLDAGIHVLRVALAADAPDAASTITTVTIQ